MLGVAMGLATSGAAEHLAGEIVFFAVPAEEFIDVEERLRRARAGRDRVPARQAGTRRQGPFRRYRHGDDDPPRLARSEDQRSFIADRQRRARQADPLLGRAAHAGGAPQRGINALSAAQIALNAIHCQRETFRDQDTVRIHPIITKGGDAVSVVPADVAMETFVRGGTLRRSSTPT